MATDGIDVHAVAVFNGDDAAVNFADCGTKLSITADAAELVIVLIASLAVEVVAGVINENTILVMDSAGGME